MICLTSFSGVLDLCVDIYVSIVLCRSLDQLAVSVQARRSSASIASEQEPNHKLAWLLPIFEDSNHGIAVHCHKSKTRILLIKKVFPHRTCRVHPGVLYQPVDAISHPELYISEANLYS